MQHDDEDAKYNRTVTMLEELRRSQMERHRQLEAANTALTADNDNLRAQLEAKTTEAADEKATTMAFLDTLEASLTAQLDNFRAELRTKTAHTATVTTLNPAQAAHEPQVADSTPPPLDEREATKADDGMSAGSATNASLASQLDACRAELQVLIDANRAHEATIAELRARDDVKESAVHFVGTLHLQIEVSNWINRGLLLKMDEAVTIDGIPYTKKECYLKALEIDPKKADAYFLLGTLIAGDETVTINGTPYTQMECFDKAIEIDPHHRRSYNALGNMLAGDDTVNINGINYSKKECYIKALESSKWHSSMCNGITMSVEESLQIARDERSVRADTWTNLGNTLADNETVNINGTSYTKEECLTKGQ